MFHVESAGNGEAGRPRLPRPVIRLITFLAALLVPAIGVSASEADLVMPDLNLARFRGLAAVPILQIGMVICLLGGLFGLLMFFKVRGLPLHRSMKDIGQVIFETCKTYLLKQGGFLAILWAFIAAIMVLYFGVLRGFDAGRVVIILAFSVLGVLGSYGVAWFGIRMNTLANSRSAFAALRGKPYDVYDIPLKSGISIGMLLISVELFMMLGILIFVPGDYAGVCFIGFAIGESLGAAALRIAGGIFTKIADIGSDLMKIVFNIKEDDARNPGVIADCTGDNAGDSVGPTADGFETYGVTGVALITFILLAVSAPAIKVSLLVWIFVMRIMMLVASALSYWINGVVARARFGKADEMNFETPLSQLVWISSIVSVIMTYAVSAFMLRDLGDGTLWWKLATIITCGTLAGAIIPELVKIFTSTKSIHVREVVASAREGGASLDILSGFVAGNFSAYWLGAAIIALMSIAFGVSTMGLGSIMAAPAVFAFGLVAFGFLGMGPVIIAVDSYGPVSDNAQSVYELSLIEEVPNIAAEIEKDFGFKPNFEKAKDFLEANDGAGNTFKASAKPVLIGTAVVGATTLIFSIIMLLTNGLTSGLEKLSILNPPFLLGLIAGGAVIYWFTGATTQAVVTGSFRAVAFIKRTIKLDTTGGRASTEDSKRVVGICTQYAQNGMVNIFFTLFFTTLAFACVDPYFFIGYLISIAMVGLYQAIFLANAGGAWDNAKKVVEVDLKEKGTPLHAASVVGDTVGDPFKDTSAVSINPCIKFTTLFGLLAVEMALNLPKTVSFVVAGIFFLISLVFVWRSFYGMRIKGSEVASAEAKEAA